MAKFFRTGLLFELFTRKYFINTLLSIVNRIYPAHLLGFLHQEANLTIEEAFGEVIRNLRKAQQFSQEKRAEVSNLDRSFISLLECGHKQPSLITIFQIAKAFNISASKIMSLVEKQLYRQMKKWNRLGHIDCTYQETFIPHLSQRWKDILFPSISIVVLE